MIKIKSKILKNGLNIRFNKKNYDIKYPKNIWKKLSDENKLFLLDNISFLTTLHLPLFFDEESISYNTNEPLLKSFFRDIVMGDIPNFCSIEGKNTNEILRQFYNIEYYFNDIDARLPNFNYDFFGDVLINFTFGKESLLTFGVCKEIGLKTELVYFYVNEGETETRLKKILAKNFSKNFKQRFFMVKNSVEYLNIAEFIGAKQNFNWGYSNQLTEYTLASLPINVETGCRFILFGNEKSCNSYFFNNDGYKAYPVFDQSIKWMLMANNILKIISKGKISTFSIVEPLNEIAIMKILHKRYPDIAKYQFSCFPDNINYNGRWCHACTKCARIFLFFKAIGVDPKTVGFEKDLFKKEFLNNFSLFNGKTNNSLVYDYSGLGRDEQLFAFYLAYRNGQKGRAIEIFKKNYLKEAKQREDELFKEFFGVFNPVTIPKEIKNNVISIFKEELGKNLM
ncbi:MAG: hypothetical protein NZ893_02795 [Candidatus Aenigmarchaeota archaeon]|nr:hypothetical protein [Candidatus Aenigmarchaeota archaeon]